MLSYLHALLEFVAAYPHVAYGLVFLAALSEALPVIGVFVPGSLIILAVSARVELWPKVGDGMRG